MGRKLLHLFCSLTVSCLIPFQARAYVFVEVYLDNGLVLKGDTVTIKDFRSMIARSRPANSLSEIYARSTVTPTNVSKVVVRPEGVTAFEHFFDGRWVVRERKFSDLQQYNDIFGETPFEIRTIRADVDPGLSQSEAYEDYRKKILDVEQRERLKVITEKIEVSKDGKIVVKLGLGDLQGVDDWQSALDSVSRSRELKLGRTFPLVRKVSCRDVLK